MREWVPVPGSARGRLVQHALKEFGMGGYDAVNVADLAELAGVTTGSLYHHFGGKLGIYSAVRDDVERRVLDRMEGAAAARAEETATARVRTAMLVGFDYLVGAGFSRLLAEEHPERDADPVEQFMAGLADRGSRPIGRLLLGIWRSALATVADGGRPSDVRAALRAVIG